MCGTSPNAIPTTALPSGLGCFAGFMGEESEAPKGKELAQSHAANVCSSLHLSPGPLPSPPAHDASLLHAVALSLKILADSSGLHHLNPPSHLNPSC